MVHLIVQLSKYIMIILFLIYTFLCFHLFKYPDKPKKQKKEISDIPQYNDPMTKEGVLPTDVLGSDSGTPLDGSQPVQDVDDL